MTRTYWRVDETTEYGRFTDVHLSGVLRGAALCGEWSDRPEGEWPIPATGGMTLRLPRPDASLFVRGALLALDFTRIDRLPDEDRYWDKAGRRHVG